MNKEILKELKPYIQKNKTSVSLKPNMSYKIVSEKLGINFFQLVELIIALNIDLKD